MTAIEVFEPTFDEIGSAYQALSDTVIAPEDICQLCCHTVEDLMAPVAGLVFIQSLEAHESYLRSTNSHVFVARRNTEYVGMARFHFPGETLSEREHHERCLAAFFENSEFDERGHAWADFSERLPKRRFVYCSLLASFDLKDSHKIIPALLGQAILKLRPKHPAFVPLPMCSYVIAGATVQSMHPNDPTYHNSHGNYPSLNLQTQRGLECIGSGRKELELVAPCSEQVREAFPLATAGQTEVRLRLTTHRHLLYGSQAFESYVNRYAKRLARLANE